MFFCLPPAGNSIVLNPLPYTEQDIESLFKPWLARFYGSGAMALAAAIITTIKNTNIGSPEVLLPAYGCPELVSAVVFAGAQPVLIDLESQSPWLSLKDVESKLSDNTVAVVAVDLFGIPERIEELREITQNSAVTIIEDSAQCFPERVSEDSWKGDLVVLSFGRGKPVSLLGGGAVLTDNAGLLEQLPDTTNRIPEPTTGLPLSYRLKATIYNRLISPELYWIPNAMPFLNLGEVKYNPMKEIQPFPEQIYALLKPNLEKYRHSKNQAQAWITEMLSRVENNDCVNLPIECGSEDNRLIRYPILTRSQDQRDRLQGKLEKEGLGATKMYKTPLNEIEGLEAILSDQGPFPNAKIFSQTLLTLPVHELVEQTHVQRMQNILRSEFQ